MTAESVLDISIATAPDVERWRPVPVRGCEERYEVSSAGRVRNRKTGRLMTQRLNAIGAWAVSLTPHGAAANKTYQVHRLVKLAFDAVANADDFYVVFKDSNPANARLDNLAWLPRQESGNAKLSGDAVQQIRARRMRGVSVEALAAEHHVAVATIHAALAGWTWTEKTGRQTRAKGGGAQHLQTLFAEKRALEARLEHVLTKIAEMRGERL